MSAVTRFGVYDPNDMRDLKSFLDKQGADYYITSLGEISRYTWHFWLKEPRVAAMTRLRFPAYSYTENV